MSDSLQFHHIVVVFSGISKSPNQSILRLKGNIVEIRKSTRMQDLLLYFRTEC